MDSFTLFILVLLLNGGILLSLLVDEKFDNEDDVDDEEPAELDAVFAPEFVLLRFVVEFEFTIG